SRPHLYLGEKYANSGQFQLAISSFAKVIKVDPSNVEALKDYAFLCLSHDQDRLWRRAKKALELAIKIRPNDAEILMNYAYTLYLNGELQRAVEYYQRSLEIRPNWEKTYYNLALVYERTGQKVLALQAYEKTVDIAPNSRQGKKALEKINKLKGIN
ncbi:TPA: tetratricopeptide repeat protein, partial [Candidatus Poribacteria bacterium]|nr:tetratricopeptide repeat protein [Candidatus Poribacteria bacterium]